jgi:hypothetical protein
LAIRVAFWSILKRGDQHGVIGLAKEAFAHLRARARLTLNVAEEVGEHLQEV